MNAVVNNEVVVEAVETVVETVEAAQAAVVVEGGEVKGEEGEQKAKLFGFTRDKDAVGAVQSWTAWIGKMVIRVIFSPKDGESYFALTYNGERVTFSRCKDSIKSLWARFWEWLKSVWASVKAKFSGNKEVQEAAAGLEKRAVNAQVELG